MRNNSVKLFWIWTSRSRGNAIKRYFLSVALAALLISGVEPFVQFWKRVLWETILWNHFEFGPVVQEEMSFEWFLIWSSGGSLVQWRQTIYAILKEGIMRKFHVMLYEIWTNGQGGDVIYRKWLWTDAWRTTDKDWSHSSLFVSCELKKKKNKEEMEQKISLPTSFGRLNNDKKKRSKNNKSPHYVWEA